MVMKYNCTLKYWSTNTLRSEIVLARMELSDLFISLFLNELFSRNCNSVS